MKLPPQVGPSKPTSPPAPLSPLLHLAIPPQLPPLASLDPLGQLNGPGHSSWPSGGEGQAQVQMGVKWGKGVKGVNWPKSLEWAKCGSSGASCAKWAKSLKLGPSGSSGASCAKCAKSLKLGPSRASGAKWGKWRKVSRSNGARTIEKGSLRCRRLIIQVSFCRTGHQMRRTVPSCVQVHRKPRNAASCGLLQEK